jgi:hypothetical protein
MGSGGSDCIRGGVQIAGVIHDGVYGASNACKIRMRCPSMVMQTGIEGGARACSI